MRIRLLADCGWCDGVALVTGAVVDLADTAALDYIALGLAEAVEEPPATRAVAPETAMVAAPERAVRAGGKARGRS